MPSLSDWQTGKSVPDGWNLYQLIRTAAGDAGAPRSALAALELARSTGEVEERAEEMLREVAQQLRSQSQLLAQLTEVAAELRALTPQAGLKPA